MRKILFRGNVRVLSRDTLPRRVYGGVEVINESVSVIHAEDGKDYFVDTDSVGQYIGFDDAFGNMLFEGDWVENCDDECGQIVWNEKEYQFGIRFGQFIEPITWHLDGLRRFE